MSKKHHIGVACLFALLAGCGGGGGGGSSSSTSNPTATPTPPDTIFHLLPPGALTQGWTQTYHLTGSDTAGGQFTGTISETTQAQTTFNGQPAIPLQAAFTLTNTVTNAFVTVTALGYYATDPANMMYFGDTNSTGDIFTAISLNVVPETAKIGDTGVIGTYAGSGSALGETETMTWELKDAGNGNAYLIINDSDFSGANLLYSEKDTYLIDPQGNRKSITAVIYYAGSGITITLSGQ